jgi:predicted membrane chloride channel (bestrophin family)
MVKLINLVKESFEGVDGKISSKKIVLFLFTVVFMFLSAVYGYLLINCKSTPSGFIEIYAIIVSSLLIQVGVNVAYNGIITKLLSSKKKTTKTKTK